MAVNSDVIPRRPPVEQPAVPRNDDALFHDLLTPDDARQAGELAREVSGRVVRPRAMEIGEREETVESFPRDVFDALAAHDLYRVPFAAADGGLGLDHRVTATARVIEELAYESSSVAAIYDVHCILAGNALSFGSQSARERYLRPLLAGEVVGAFATTEPLASSDLSPGAVTTLATRTRDGYRIDGHKRFISNAPVADLIVVLARLDDQLSLFVVDTAQDGVRVGPPDRKLGNRAQLTADVHLDGALVSAEHRVGREGEGLRLALATLTFGRIGIAASGVGLAQAAFDQAVAHLRRRRAFGRRLGEFQHWQFLMAERAMALESARSMYLKAALRLDSGVAFPEPEAAMAKASATALAVDMARDAIQVLGGYGFLRELGADGTRYRVEEIYRDAKIAEIYEGTNEIQHLVIARQIFGKELTG